MPTNGIQFSVGHPGLKNWIKAEAVSFIFLGIQDPILPKITYVTHSYQRLKLFTGKGYRFDQDILDWTIAVVVVKLYREQSRP